MKKNIFTILFLIICILSIQKDVLSYNIPNLIITIEIDTEKSDNAKWDRLNFWGVPPDVYGKIKFPYYVSEIEFHENTYSLALNFENVAIQVGESIEIELFDRDRGRIDDLIAKGNIIFNGERIIDTRIGFATIRIESII